jgi:31-O-methyltransferase
MITEYELPNGLKVSQINSWETLALYREIFTGRCYAKNGVSIPMDAPIVDVGANIGMATLFFHREAPGARIVAVEPAPVPLQALQSNIDRFGIPARAIPAAVGAEPGGGHFAFYPSHTISSGRFAESARDADKVERFFRAAGVNAQADTSEAVDFTEAEDCECSIITLAEVLADADVHDVGLLKMDAEGAEMEVFTTLPDDVWCRIAQMVVEVHGDYTNASHLCKLMEARGMTVTVEKDSLGDDRQERVLFARRS